MACVSMGTWSCTRIQSPTASLTLTGTNRRFGSASSLRMASNAPNRSVLFHSSFVPTTSLSLSSVSSFPGAWTYSAVDTVEGLTKIKTGTLYTLSVQEIVDCNSGGYHGCTGGFTYEAFEFIKQHGLTSKANYPSKTDKSTCDIKKEAQPVAKITGYEDVPANSEEALLKTLANQPVAVTVDASGAAFQFYSSGVFTADCGTDLDHSVTAIGYGTSDDNGLKYWLIKNSWGTSWGEEGYMRMQRDIKAKGGECGIAMEASYPTT